MSTIAEQDIELEPWWAKSGILLVFLAVFIFLLQIPFFHAPFERDQGTYATIARGWMHGALPYRDLFDNKGPLLFLWYIASFLVFGDGIVAPRAMAGLAAALSLPFVWATAKNMFGRRKGALASIFYALSFSNVYLQANANAEVFMLLPMAAGFWAFTEGSRKYNCLWFVLAGILTSLAVFTRQSAVLTFAGYAIWLAGVWLKFREERNRQVFAAISVSAGAVLGALPFVLYFAYRGALYELWFAMFGFNFGWVAEQSFFLKFVPPLFIEPGPLAGGLIFWIIAAAGLWKLRKRNDRSGWLVIAFLAVSEAAAQAMGKGSAHYSIQLLPAASIAAAFGTAPVVAWWKRGGGMAKPALAAASLITLSSLVFAYTQPTAEERFRVQYTFRNYADDATQASAIASAVAGISPPGTCVYEWGRSSQIFYLADRQPCSRWFYDRPYEVNTGMISAVMADLERRKPSAIFITGELPIPPELNSFINRDYQHAGQVKYASLFRRVTGP